MLKRNVKIETAKIFKFRWYNLFKICSYTDVDVEKSFLSYKTLLANNCRSFWEFSATSNRDINGIIYIY